MDDKMEMTVEDAALDSAWGDEDSAGFGGEAEEQGATNTAEGKSAADQPAALGGPGKAKGFGGERRSAGTSELSPPGGSEGYGGRDDALFTLKNRDETRQVTRDQVIAMAQKGWDYDTVRAERDQLRQYRKENDPTLEMVRLSAQGKGMTVPEYLDHCRRQDLDQGRAQTGPGQGNALIQRFRQNARMQDMRRFLDAYPGVKAESIPREVWAQVARGVPLVSAYARHENQRLRAELAAERQDRANRARTPGGLGANSGGELDEIDRLWGEDD